MSNNAIQLEEQFAMLPISSTNSFVNNPVTSGFMTASNFSTAGTGQIMATFQHQYVQVPYTSSRHVEFHHWRLQVLEFRREARRQVVPKFLLMSSDDFLLPSDSSYSIDRVQFIDLGLPCSTKSRSAKKVHFDVDKSSAKRLHSPEIIDLTESPPAKKARKGAQKQAKKNVAKEVKPPKDPFVNKTFEDSAMILAKISRKAKSQEGGGSGFSTPTKPKVQFTHYPSLPFILRQRAKLMLAKQAKREVIVKFTFPAVNDSRVAIAEQKERIVGGIDITGITCVHIYPFHVYSMMNFEEHFQFFTPKTFIEAMLLEAHELVSLLASCHIILFTPSCFWSTLRQPLLFVYIQSVKMTDNSHFQFTHPPSPNLQAVSKSFSTTSGSDILTLIVTLMESSALDTTTNMTIRHMLTVLHYTPYLSVYQTFFNMFDAAIKVTNTIFEKHSKGGACDDIKVMICKVMSGFIEYDIGCYWEDKRIAAGGLANTPGDPEDNSGVADVQDEIGNEEDDEGLFVSNNSGGLATSDGGDFGAFGKFYNVDDDLVDLEYRMALERESDLSMLDFGYGNLNLRGGAGSSTPSLNSLFSGGSNLDADGEFELGDTPANGPALNPALESNYGNGGPKHCSSIGGAPKGFLAQLTLLGIKADPKIVNLKVLIEKVWPGMFKARLEEILDNAGVNDELLKDWLGRTFR